MKPSDLVLGEELVHNQLIFNEPRKTFVETIDKIYNVDPQTLEEKRIIIEGFFLGDGTSGIDKYESRENYCWGLSNLHFSFIEKLRRYSKEVWNDIDFKYMMLEKVVMSIKQHQGGKNSFILS